MRTKKKKRKDEIRTLKSLRNNHVIWFQENGRLGMRWSETGEVCTPATYNDVHCKPCDFDDEDTKWLFDDMNNKKDNAMMNKRLRIIVFLLVWGIMSICLYVSIYTQMPLYSKILCASFATIMYFGLVLTPYVIDKKKGKRKSFLNYVKELIINE